MQILLGIVYIIVFCLNACLTFDHYAFAVYLKLDMSLAHWSWHTEFVSTLEGIEPMTSWSSAVGLNRSTKMLLCPITFLFSLQILHKSVYNTVCCCYE